MGHDVFISYSTKDKKFASYLIYALERNGVKCWVAPRDIPPGSSWPSAILRGIEHCRLMVLIFSSNANTSEHVRREVERAVFRGIPVAPVRIEEVLPTDDLEYFLSSAQWIDAMSGPVEKEVSSAATRLRRRLGIKRPDSIKDHKDLPVIAADLEQIPQPPPPRLPLTFAAYSARVVLGTSLLTMILAGLTEYRIYLGDHEVPAKTGNAIVDALTTDSWAITRYEPGTSSINPRSADESFAKESRVTFYDDGTLNSGFVPEGQPHFSDNLLWRGGRHRWGVTGSTLTLNNDRFHIVDRDADQIQLARTAGDSSSVAMTMERVPRVGPPAYRCFIYSAWGFIVAATAPALVWSRKATRRSAVVMVWATLWRTVFCWVTLGSVTGVCFEQFLMPQSSAKLPLPTPLVISITAAICGVGAGVAASSCKLLLRMLGGIWRRIAHRRKKSTTAPVDTVQKSREIEHSRVSD